MPEFRREPVLDHGYVQLIETWGSDQRVIESARMSTDKGFLGWGPRHTEECEVGMDSQLPCSCDPKPGDEKLLSYLYSNAHMTPFEMAGMTIEVQAPIMVFREWHRHRTQGYNEMSGRYTVLPALYYVPSLGRIQHSRQDPKNKQGSSQSLWSGEEVSDIQSLLAAQYATAREAYEGLLDRGVAKEVARLVLPVAQYSRMRATANLRNWLAFLTLRDAPAAQWEIRQYAALVSSLVRDYFPRTFELFAQGRGQR